jgi:predicted membrane protein
VGLPINGLLYLMSRITPNFYSQLFYRFGVEGIFSKLLLILAYTINITVLVILFSIVGLMMMIKKKRK